MYDVGVVGAGHIASAVHLPILSNMDETRVGYVADIQRERAERALLGYSGNPVEISGNPSALPECAVALVATPVGVRSEYIEEFSRRGTPVMTEKPFAPDRSTHREFIAENNRMACNYQYVNFSCTRQARSVLETALFGDLEAVDISHGLVPVSGIGPGHYRTDVELSGGGVLVESGCHGFSQIAHIFEDCSLRVTDAEITWQESIDVEADVHLMAETADRTVPIRYRLSMTRPLDTEFRFVFENAEVRFDHTDAESTLTVEGSGDATGLTVERDPEWAITGKEATYLNWRAFLRELQRGDTFDVEGQTELTVTELIAATYEQAGDRRGLG